MTTTINASPTNGIVATGDGSGVMKLQSNGVTTNALAWVNFNGTGTVAIRSSYNVSSITDNGTGDYTVNFATALSDANYSVIATTVSAPTGNANVSSIAQYSTDGINTTGTTSSTVRLLNKYGTNANDVNSISVAIFGN